MSSLVERFYTRYVASVEVKSFHCTNRLLATEHLLEIRTTINHKQPRELNTTQTDTQFNTFHALQIIVVMQHLLLIVPQKPSDKNQIYVWYANQKVLCSACKLWLWIVIILSVMASSRPSPVRSSLTTSLLHLCVQKPDFTDTNMGGESYWAMARPFFRSLWAAAISGPPTFELRSSSTKPTWNITLVYWFAWKLP